MENLNSNTDYRPSYDTIKQQRDHFEERLKIEREKREALENKIASFLDPIIESKLDDFKTDLEDKVYELESKVDDIDTEVDIAEMVATELNELIRDNRLTVRLELDWSMADTKVNLKPAAMFNTPEDWDELQKWINLHTNMHERLHIMTAACMAWNLACKYVNDESDQ